MTHYEYSFPVRYYETDQMGVVHHSNYVRYFETARDQMMVDWGFPITRCEQEFGVLIPVVGVEIRFKRPARMGDTVTSIAEIERVPMAKLFVKQKVLNQNGELCAEGMVTLGFLNAKTFTPVPCPDVLVKIIEEHINER